MNVQRSQRSSGATQVAKMVACMGSVVLLGAGGTIRPVNADPLAPHRRVGQGAITGTVFDSVSNRPLANAFVQILKPDGSAVLGTAFTDQQGRFRAAAPNSGPVLVGAMHPLLDSLGTPYLVRRAEVTTSADAVVALSTPGIGTLRGRWCGAHTNDDGTGVVLGTVTVAADAESSDMRVEARWTELVVSDSSVMQRLHVIEATPAADGRFVVCGVPRESRVALFAAHGSDTTKVRLIMTSSRGFERADLSFTRVEATGVNADVSSLSFAGARGTTRMDTVRVRADGRLYTPWFDRAAFEERRRRGFGMFLGPEEIERRNPLRTTDLLQGMPSVRVGQARFGDGSIKLISSTFKPEKGGSVPCTPTFWVDGLEVDEDLFRLIANPRDILAIEVYQRPYVAPGQFVSLRNFQSKENLECGSIVLWTGKRPPRGTLDGEGGR